MTRSRVGQLDHCMASSDYRKAPVTGYYNMFTLLTNDLSCQYSISLPRDLQ